jgi:hypothetical protein
VSLEATLPLLVEYTRLCREVAAMGAGDAAVSLFESLGYVFTRYRNPRGFSGSYSVIIFDFYKFIGHELIVTLVGSLLTAGRFEILGDVLEHPIYVDNRSDGTAGTVDVYQLWQKVELLEYRKQRRQLGVLTVQGDLLNLRHSQGELGDLFPTVEAAAADFFLFLRAELDPNPSARWLPVSVPFIAGQLPRFLGASERRRHAERLLRPLGAEDLESLRRVLAASAGRLQGIFNDAWWFEGPLTGFNPESVGTR